MDLGYADYLRSRAFNEMKDFGVVGRSFGDKSMDFVTHKFETSLGHFKNGAKRAFYSLGDRIGVDKSALKAYSSGKVNELMATFDGNLINLRKNLDRLMYDQHLGGLKEARKLATADNKIKAIDLEIKGLEDSLAAGHEYPLLDHLISKGTSSGESLRAAWIRNLNEMESAQAIAIRSLDGKALSAAESLSAIPVKSELAKNVFGSAAYGAGSGALAAPDGAEGQGAMVGLVMGAAAPMLFKSFANLTKLTPGPVKEMYEKVVSSPFFIKNFQSIDKGLRRLGQEGEGISNLFSHSRLNIQKRAATEWLSIEGGLQKTTREMRDDMRKLIEHYDDANYIKELDARYAANPEALQNVKELASNFRAIAKQYDADAKELGLSITDSNGNARPWTGMNNYFPHIADPDLLEKFIERESKKGVVSKQGSFIDQMAYRLVKEGKATSHLDGIRQAEKMLKNTHMRRGKYLEHEREFDMPYEVMVDPQDAMKAYILNSARRIEQAKAFGLRGETVRALQFDKDFNAIGINPDQGERSVYDSLYGQYYRRVADPKKQELFRNLVDRMLELDHSKTYSEGDFLRSLRSIQGFSLGLSQITNLTQGINALVTRGVRNTAQGYREALTKDGIDLVKKAGAMHSQTFDAMPEFLARERPSAGFGKKIDAALNYYLNKTGFTASEKINRTMSAFAGKNFVIDAIGRLQKGEAIEASTVRSLQKLGLNADDLIGPKAIKEITDPRLGKAMYNAAKNEQFLTEAFDLPYNWANPYAKVALQFKSYAFKQTEFIKRAVIDEAMQGNTLPLARLVFFGSLVGEGLGNTKAMLRGDTTRVDKDGLERELDNLASIGAFGILFDTVKQTARSPQGMAALIAGPTIGDIGDTAYGATQAAAGKPAMLERSMLRQVPIAGSMLSSKLVPTEAQQSAGAFKPTLNDSLETKLK